MIKLNLKTGDQGGELSYEVCGLYEVEEKLYAVLMESAPNILIGNGEVHVREVVICNETNMWYVSATEDSIATCIKTVFASNWIRFYHFKASIEEIIVSNSHEHKEGTGVIRRFFLKYRDDQLPENGAQTIEVYGFVLDDIAFKETKNKVPNPLGSGYILSWDLVEWFYNLVSEPEEYIASIKNELNEDGKVRMKDFGDLREHIKGSPLPQYCDCEGDSVANELINVFNRAIRDCVDDTRRTKYLEIVKKIVDTVLSIDFRVEGDTELDYHAKRASVISAVLCSINNMDLDELSYVEKFIDNPDWDRFHDMLPSVQPVLKKLCCFAMLDFNGETPQLDWIETEYEGKLIYVLNEAHLHTITLLAGEIGEASLCDITGDGMQPRKFRQFNIEEASKKLSPQALATDRVGLKILASKNDYKPFVKPLTLAKRKYHLPRKHF